MKAREPLIDAVCGIVGQHRIPGKEAQPDTKIVYDADWVAQMEERLKEQSLDTEQVSEMIDRDLLTEAGKEEARAVLLS